MPFKKLYIFFLKAASKAWASPVPFQGAVA